MVFSSATPPASTIKFIASANFIAAATIFNFFSSVNKTDNSLPEKSYRYFCSALKSISKKNVEDYLKHQKKITRRFCKKSSMHPKELHELRKTLKNISYTERLLEQKISNKKSITENLSNILGKWHDMQVTIDHLRKNVKSKKINQQEKLFLEKIILTLISKKDRYFEAIQSGISRMNAGYIKI